MVICFPVTYALSISSSVYWVIQLDLMYLLGLSLRFVSFELQREIALYRLLRHMSSN